MSSSPVSFLLRHRRLLLLHHHQQHHHILLRHLSTASSSSPDPRSNLSARLSFIFDQIDAIDRDRSRELADKDQALQRIRSWRHSNSPATPTIANNQEEQQQDRDNVSDFLKKEVEVVHPWPEWIELLELLGHQNYFDRRTSSFSAEGGLAEEVREEVGFDFSRDWITVRNACINFGRDRFDILKSLPRKDLQVLVGHGCPSLDPKVVFSAKLLRKHVHLDEGDVCSSCSLRNSCGRGYILTRKEDEARTLDVMRILLTFGFDHVNGAVENKPLMKMKSVKTVVRKLLHEVVKLSAVPIDPNLPPPVIKKPPPKVKQPPPQPKKRVGRDDVEMKKGDWLCVKCDFMNFAKNTVCLQCDAKRPKRQLLPGEWECPQCNFLNYRRNMACFHCDAKRPEDEFTQNQFMERQSSPRTRMERPTRMQDVSDAWNFDFDDNESDGADVAAFEFADSAKVGKDSALDDPTQGRSSRGFEDDIRDDKKMPRSNERGRYFSDDDERESPTYSKRTGFDDFDDEEDDVESYELDGSNNNQTQEVSRKNFSEVENTSGSEELDDFDRRTNFKQGADDLLSGSEDDELSEQPHWKSSHIADSWQKSRRKGRKSPGTDAELDSDYDDDDMDVEDRPKLGKNHKQKSHSKGKNRRVRDSDSDGSLFFDSDSDDNIKGNFTEDKGRPQGRRMNNYGRQNDNGSARRGEFRSSDRTSNRRTSFANSRDDLSSSRGSGGDGYAGRRRNDNFQHFDSLEDGNRNSRRSNNIRGGSRGGRRDERGSSNNFSNNFSDRSRGGRREERGSSYNFSDGSRGERREERGYSNNFSDRSRGGRGFGRGSSNNFGGRRDERGSSNNFSDRSRGRRRDERGPHRDEWRGGGDGFRNEKSDNFSGRNRRFVEEDNGEDDRPRRRIIER